MSDLRPGVIFDVDGTLLDTNYLHTLAWWQAFEDVREKRLPMADIHQAIGIASSGLVHKLLGHDAPDAIERHSARYEALRQQVVPLDGASDLLHACAERGLVVVLATSGEKSDLDWMLPALGAEDVIEGSTTSGDVEEGKPAPDLIGTALREHGLDPARTVAIGDTVWDVQAAHDAGVRCVAVTCGGIDEARLRDAGADQVFAGPRDLLERWDDSLLAGLTD